MTLMQGDWHDYGFDLCAKALDWFLINGFAAVFLIGIGIIEMVREQILKCKDICELNNVMVSVVRKHFESMPDKTAFFARLSPAHLVKESTLAKL